MNYRHVFHAGNFADVVKHAALARILVHLAEKPAAFRVIDVHAGAALYDLHGEEARRTAEWRGGIGRLQEAALPAAARGLLAPYLAAVARANPEGGLRRYPGSPLIALALMRPQDRLVACELEPRAAAALGRRLAADRRAKAIAIDGWQGLRAFIPPAERRGLVVIDPPFEDADEFAKLGPRLAEAVRKWATGVYLVWYPVKGAAAAGFIRALRSSGIGKMLRAELNLAAPEPGRLTGCGLVVVNPPWRLKDELGVLLPALHSALGGAAGGVVRVEALADKI